MAEFRVKCIAYTHISAWTVLFQTLPSYSLPQAAIIPARRLINIRRLSRLKPQTFVTGIVLSPHRVQCSTNWATGTCFYVVITQYFMFCWWNSYLPGRFSILTFFYMTWAMFISKLVNPIWLFCMNFWIIFILFEVMGWFSFQCTFPFLFFCL